MPRLRLTIGQLMKATVAVAVGLAALRVLGPDRGLPLLASLWLGCVAFAACRQRASRASWLIGAAYLIVVATALLLGETLSDRVGLLMGLTLLAYPSILGSGLGYWAASRRLPSDRPVTRLDDLVLTLTVVPLVLALPAVVMIPLRQIVRGAGWLN